MLTEKGRQAVVQATPYARENGQLLADLLTSDEADELQRLLRVLIDGTPATLQTL